MKTALLRTINGDRAVVFAIALAACAGAGALLVQVRDMAQQNAEVAAHHRHINDLQQSLYRLDLARRGTVFDFWPGRNEEVAATYRDIADQQGSALAQLREEVRGAEFEAAADGAIAAYQAVLERERTALAFSLDDNRAGVAVTLLSAEYYQSINDMYAALNRLRSLAWRDTTETTAAAERRTRLMAFETLAMAFLIVALAAAAMLRLSARRADADRAAFERDAAIAKLAQREREINANLVARNPLPAIEFDFAPAAKLAAWLRSRGIEDLERWLSLYPGEIRKLSPQFKVGHFSPSAAALLGASDAEQLRDLDRWLPDRAKHHCALAMLRAIWNKEPDIELELEARGFDGEPRHIELKGRILTVKHGRPPTLIASLIDVTDTRQIEEEVKTLRRMTEDASRTQNAFITSVNRDLRAPLDGVTGMANALRRTRLDREQAGMLDVIVDSGEAMRDTINRALDFSKLEAGELEIAEHPFNVPDLVETVRARFEPQAASKKLALRMHVDSEANGWMLGDEARVRQILSKLIANAIAFTPHGEVEARLSIAPHGEDGELLTLAVRDTGPGLCQEELAAALDDDASKRGGLALCRRLCEAMGGALEVKSSSDYGTTVTARIRARLTEAPAEGRDADGSRGPAARRISILAADDNAINRMVLADMFESRDVDLTVVENGADAIATFKARRFDVILLDLQMPLLSGYDVARELRRLEHEELRDRTPIVAVSASVMRSEINAAREAGFDNHVAKPIDPKQLFDAIDEELAKAAAIPAAVEAAG